MTTTLINRPPAHVEAGRRVPRPDDCPSDGSGAFYPELNDAFPVSTGSELLRLTPELGNLEDAAALSRWFRAQPAERQDALLQTWIVLAQNHAEGALTLVLQVMRPAVLSRCRWLHRGGRRYLAQHDLDSPVHLAACAMIDSIAAFDTSRPRRHIAACLAKNALNRIVEPRRRRVQSLAAEDRFFDNLEAEGEFGADPSERVPAGTAPDPDADLAAVLNWAVEKDVITRAERSLLLQVYTDDRTRTPQVVAAEMGVTPEVVRSRCYRASRRVARAVAQDLDAGAEACTRRSAA